MEWPARRRRAAESWRGFRIADCGLRIADWGGFDWKYGGAVCGAVLRAVALGGRAAVMAWARAAARVGLADMLGLLFSCRFWVLLTP